MITCIKSVYNRLSYICAEGFKKNLILRYPGAVWVFEAQKKIPPFQFSNNFFNIFHASKSVRRWIGVIKITSATVELF